MWHKGLFRPLRLLFSLAAVFAAGLALFLAAGGAVVTAALFAGAAGGEHGRGGGEDGEGEEGERQFHKIRMFWSLRCPLERHDAIPRTGGWGFAGGSSLG